MQSLDIVSTQYMKYMKCKPRAGNDMDSFSINTTVLKLATLHIVISAWTKNQANKHNLRPFNSEILGTSDKQI